MSQYTIEELINRWRQEELDIRADDRPALLALAALQQRMRDVERRLPPSAEAAPGTLAKR